MLPPPPPFSSMVKYVNKMSKVVLQRRQKGGKKGAGKDRHKIPSQFSITFARGEAEISQAQPAGVPSCSYNHTSQIPHAGGGKKKNKIYLFSWSHQKNLFIY